ncbi:MAG: Type flagellar switch regulator (C-ring) FliN C-term [Polyangiaceae bacterium]|jgi:flagellar motor switch protein FliM|nr:Type flagellar switch regulator (C-ring) FliN C-term [Polyangiaceae bacterium]
MPAFAEAEDNLRRVDLTGRERHLKGAMYAMSHVAQRFTRSARKTLPFLVKRRARLVAEPVCIVDLGAERVVERGPVFEIVMEAEEGPAWACLTLGPEALGVMLEGALGGSEKNASSGIGADLTLAQAALVSKLARKLAEDFAEAVKSEVGIVLRATSARSIPAGDERDAAFADGLRSECAFEGMPGDARISIAMGAEALESAAKGEEEPVEANDPRMSEAIIEVPVEVVAELGRVRLGLRRVLSLEVGQVLRLATAVDDPVIVRIAGVEKFRGAPVISRGQVSVEIRGRHED